MGDVTDFTGSTTLRIDPERVLDSAKDCSDVLVLGWKNDDFYMAQSDSAVAETLLLLEIAREYLLRYVMSGHPEITH